MNQEKLYAIVRARFVLMYKDFGFYRWTVRNLSELKPAYLAGLFVSIVAYLGEMNKYFIAIWAACFVLHIWLCGVEHFLIGLRLKKILNSLKAEGIHLTLNGLLRICEPVIPE